MYGALFILVFLDNLKYLNYNIIDLSYNTITLSYD